MRKVNWFKQVSPIIDYSVRNLCTLRYPNHPCGCPNYNKRKTCPPQAPILSNILDMNKPIFIIFNQFEFGKHCDKMRKRHPEWTDRQVRNCLYWQGTARKYLKQKINVFLNQNPSLLILTCPEACGVNITETMKQTGIILEWPPMRFAYQVAIAGSERK